VDRRNVPVLGINISPSTASGVLLFPDDKMEYLPLIATEPKLHAVLRQLQAGSSAHLRHPYHGMYLGLLSLSDEWPRLFWRNVRKSLGLPATAQVGVLAKPVLQLRAEAAKVLGYNPTEAMVITPAIRALYDEDVLDMMIYVRMGQLPLREGYGAYDNGCEEPHELVAAYAGRGFGLCKTWWNATACKEEDDAQWRGLNLTRAQTIVVVELSPVAMSIDSTWSSMTSAMQPTWEGAWRSGIRFFDAPGDSYKWAEIYTLLEKHLPEAIPYDREWYTPIQAIHFIGPGGTADNHRLKTLVQKVLREHNPPIPIPDILDANPHYAAAVGAAEMGRRGQFITRSPWGWKVAYGGTAPTSAVANATREEMTEGLELEMDLKRRALAPDPWACSWYSYSWDEDYAV
jgi:hypothetical protein